MFNNPTVLSLYAQARMIDDRASRYVAPVAPRRRNPFARLFAIRPIVSTHNGIDASVPRLA
jgi:hypothetical protein